MNTTVMFSSATDEWETPQEVFDALNAEFGFAVDLAASPDNTKVPGNYYRISDSALDSNWYAAFPSHMGYRSVGWCNPPYSRGLQAKFIAKAAEERRRGFLTVMLLPARTDTKAFHAHIYDASRWQPRDGIEIRFLPGRLKFGGAANSAPFPSMVVVFRP
jgi:phage N-6-adenine-methyltransferase